MKTKCAICGGEFKFLPLYIHCGEERRETRVLTCVRCGDTQGGPEQIFSARIKTDLDGKSVNPNATVTPAYPAGRWTK